MRILVSNDDGIYAEGILALTAALLPLGEVTVVEPDMERSAAGHAITMHHPLRVQRVNLPNLPVTAYSVDGTPADCVKIGVDILMEEPPDFVFTGINRGANLGTDVLYSGTVSAAMEGCILGIPSAAFSAVGSILDLTYAKKAAAKVASLVMQGGLPLGTLLNVNIPNLPEAEVQGMRATRMGTRRYEMNYVRREDPRGRTYYWLAGEAVDEAMDTDTDIHAVAEGYVSITPLHWDLTRHDVIERLSQTFLERML